MKKKIISALLLVCMLVSLMAMVGCDRKNPGKLFSGNFEIPEGGYDGSEVTITFYHTMGSNLSDVLDLYIAEFNELYPNIHIKWTKVGGYDDVRDQIKTELTVGDQPNIAYCYPDHVALYNIAKSVVTLDDLIASDIEVKHADGTTEILGLTQAQIDDFIPGYYAEGKAYGDDLMYTLPLSKSTEVLYYNKTFFEEHGLEAPTTWDEMEELCARIKEIDPDCVPLGYDSESNWFITMCEQLGTDYTSATGEHFKFNNAENKAFVKRFCEWYKKGYVTTQEIYGTYTSGMFTGKKNEETGKVTQSYMSIGSSAGATHQRPDKVNGEYPFEVGITSIPQIDANNPKVISQGPSLCIFKSENDQEVIASWLFVKYLATCVEFQAEFSLASGYIPVIKSVIDNEIYAKEMADANGTDNITTLSVKVGLEQADAYYVSPAFNGSSAARDAVGNLIQAAFVQTATADESTIDSIIDKVFEDAIKECNKK